MIDFMILGMASLIWAMTIMVASAGHAPDKRYQMEAVYLLDFFLFSSPVPWWAMASSSRLRASYALRQDGSVSKAAVYHEYAALCEQRSLEMANRSVFGKLVKRTFPFVGSRRLGKRSENSMHYTHIGPIFLPASASPSFAIPSATALPAARRASVPTSSSMSTPSISTSLATSSSSDGPRGSGLVSPPPATSSISMSPLSCPRSLSDSLPAAHYRDPAGWVKMAHQAPQRRWSEADSSPQRPDWLDSPPLHTASWHLHYTRSSSASALPEYDLGVSCEVTTECSSPGLDRSRLQATAGRQATSATTPPERTQNSTFGGEHLF